jgi:hypothetical protein
VPASEPRPADPFGDVAARFRALAAHPELATLLGSRPDVPELGGKTLPSLLLLFLLGALGLFASILFLQLCPPLGFAPLALVVVGIPVLAVQMIRRARTPLVGHAAMVVERRARLQAGAEHSPAHTRQHATLQFDDGRRVELECYASALPALEVGALGVAHVKGDRLAAFTRLPV